MRIRQSSRQLHQQQAGRRWAGERDGIKMLHQAREGGCRRREGARAWLQQANILQTHHSNHSIGGTLRHMQSLKRSMLEGLRLQH